MRAKLSDTISFPGGPSFYLQGWESPEPSETLLLIHHGLGEHGGRYQSFADGLADLPVHIWTFDCRGHGRTSGKRGDAGSLNDLALDFEQLIPVIRERTGAKQIFLMGHSMGGAVLCWMLTKLSAPHDLAGVLLSAPGLAVDLDLAAKVKVKVGRLFAKLAPHVTLPSDLDSSGISSLPAEVERYLDDPLVHGQISLELARSLIYDAFDSVESAREVRAPVLAWHGMDDPIVAIRGTRAFVTALSVDDKELHEFEGVRHESHHDTVAPELFSLVSTWISARL